MARAMTAACRWASEQAEGAAGAEHPADRGQRGGGILDHLEHPVAEHHVGSLDQAGEPVDIALDAGDLDPDLAGPAVQRGQGVGAGVDHGDPVAELGDPDREAAGAAADVEHVAGTLPRAPGAARPRPRRCGWHLDARWQTWKKH